MEVVVNRDRFVVPLLVLALLFMGLYSITLRAPYHLDTAFYMETVKGFMESGAIQCHYNTRCMVEYTLLPLSLVIGNLTLPVTIALTAVIALFIYYLWASEIANRDTAIMSAVLLLVIPSSIITITHVKEDFIGLMYLVISLYLVDRAKSFPVKFLSGIFFGFALLSKEPIALFIPFYLAYVYVKSVKLESSWKELATKSNIIDGLKNVVIFFLPALIAVFLINSSQFANTINLTKSPYLGQFLGFFSPLLPTGISLWIYGIGSILFYLQFIGLLAVYFEKNIPKKTIYALLMIQFFVLSFAFCNNTVVHYRYFLWTSFLSFPMMILGLQKLMVLWKQKKNIPLVTYGLFGLIAISLLLSAMPVISFRSTYNPVSEFYSNINVSKENSLFLGMDSCGLVEYYTGVKCINHPVDASVDDATAFVHIILGYVKNGTNVYLLPDFYSYDGNNKVRQLFTIFNSNNTVYENWYEDYHAMSYGYSLDEFKKEISNQARGCKVDYRLAGEQSINQDVKLEVYTYSVTCGVSQPQTFEYPAVDGRVLTSFGRGKIVQLLKKEAA
jgi:hypothetical protein